MLFRSATALITKILDTANPSLNKEDETSQSWEIKTFYHQASISAINKLSYFQMNVRLAELETLESIESGYLENVQKSISKN